MTTVHILFENEDWMPPLRQALAERGLTVVEHHTELLAIADRLVELGPEGGAAGGRILCTGTPSELAVDPASVTGPWLAQDLLLPAPASALVSSHVFKSASRQIRPFLFFCK